MACWQYESRMRRIRSSMIAGWSMARRCMACNRWHQVVDANRPLTMVARAEWGLPSNSIDEVARLVAMLATEDLPSLTGETIVMDGAQNINQ